MELKEHLNQSLDFHRWRVGRISEMLASAGDEICNKPTGLTFGSLKAIAHHLAWAEQVWFRRIKPSQAEILREGMSLNEILDSWKKVNQLWADFVRNLSDVDLDAIIAYKDLKGNPYENSVKEIFFHVVDHATYHCGQMMSSARAVGIEPVATSLIIYFRMFDKKKA